MRRVTSHGGPRLLLPTADVPCWIDEIREAPLESASLYGLACSVSGFCGVVHLWGSPLLVLGDDSADIYLQCHDHDKIFYRWVVAEPHDQLRAFAFEQIPLENWDENTPFESTENQFTLLDTSAPEGDDHSSFQLTLQVDHYTVYSKVAESDKVTTVIHYLNLGSSLSPRSCSCPGCVASEEA